LPFIQSNLQIPTIIIFQGLGLLESVIERVDIRRFDSRDLSGIPNLQKYKLISLKEITS